VRLSADAWPTKDAAGWRAFWKERGMGELTTLLADCWRPLLGRPAEQQEAAAFRIASLLGSRAPRAAIAEELARIREHELGAAPAPEDDERAAATIAAWFTSAAA
jgi:hypothetical protein